MPAMVMPPNGACYGAKCLTFSREMTDQPEVFHESRERQSQRSRPMGGCLGGLITSFVIMGDAKAVDGGVDCGGGRNEGSSKVEHHTTCASRATQSIHNVKNVKVPRSLSQQSGCLNDCMDSIWRESRFNVVVHVSLLKKSICLHSELGESCTSEAVGSWRRPPLHAWQTPSHALFSPRNARGIPSKTTHSNTDPSAPGSRFTTFAGGSCRPFSGAVSPASGVTPYFSFHNFLSTPYRSENCS